MTYILSFIFGILISSFFTDNISRILLIVSIIVVIVKNFSKISIKKLILIIILFMCGFFYYFSFEAYIDKKYSQLDKRDEKLNITVISELKYTDDKVMFTGKIEEYGNIKAYVVLKTGEEISYGDKITLTADVKSFENKSNTPSFSIKEYYYSNKIFLKVYGDRYKKIEEINDLSYRIYRLKERIYYAFDMNFSYKTSSFLKGIILGYDGERETEFSEALQKTGLSHIVVVSGMHFSIINMLLIIILRKMRIKRKISSIISVFVSLILAVFIGFSPSVTRAFIMLTILNISDIVSRERKTDIYLVSVTAFLMVLSNPFLINNAGFILSFVSVSGIILFNEKISAKLKFLPRYVKDVFSVSLSANILTLPLCIYYFRGIPLMFLISNLIITVFLTVIMAYGILIVIISFFSFKLSYYVGIPLDYIVKFLVDSIVFNSEIPYAYIETAQIEKYSLIVYFTAIYIFLSLKRCVLKYLITGILFLYFSFSLFYNVQSHLLNYAEINILCGKDSGKVLITYKDKNIFIDLSNNNNYSDYSEIFDTCFYGETDTCILGNAYNVNTASMYSIKGSEVYYPYIITNDKSVKEIINANFLTFVPVDGELELKYYDIYLTLKMNKSYNISMVTINKGEEEIVITNDFNENLKNKRCVITYEMLKYGDYDNVINCENTEIVRIKI